jgi:exopolysaccharide biosynthesis polyprenyl glycosylphosphotransferase
VSALSPTSAAPRPFAFAESRPQAWSLRRRRGWVVRRALLAADITGLLSAYFLAALLATGGASPKGAAEFAATLGAWVVGAKLYGLYEGDEERADRSTLDDVGGVVHLVTMGTWLLFLASWITGVGRSGLPAFITLWPIAIALMLVARAVARGVCRRTRAYLETAVIVGAGEIGRLIERKLQQHPEYRIDVVGFVDAKADEGVLGVPADLPELVERLAITRVIVTGADDTARDTLDILRRLGDHGVQVDLAPQHHELVGPRGCLHTLEGFPLVGVPPASLSPSSALIKRTMDVVAAGLALLLTAPLFAYIAWSIKRDSSGPVFFRQTRLGLNMKEFTVLKFRTMRVDVDDSEHRDFIAHSMSMDAQTAGNGLFKLERRNDVTRFGAWLRKTSLDELPQLINVLRGDMSLVGPRPCIPYETEHFAPHHFDRFLVPAGITGLWQVTARAHTTFGEALDMDVAYARGWSLGLDLKLLLRTPFQVLSQKATA